MNNGIAYYWIVQNYINFEWYRMCNCVGVRPRIIKCQFFLCEILNFVYMEIDTVQLFIYRDGSFSSKVNFRWCEAILLADAHSGILNMVYLKFGSAQAKCHAAENISTSVWNSKKIVMLCFNLDSKVIWNSSTNCRY